MFETITTLKKLREEYGKIHSKISKEFYTDKISSASDFGQAHMQLQIDFNAAKIRIAPRKQTDVEKAIIYMKGKGWI